jgi:hypothetical protein
MVLYGENAFSDGGIVTPAEVSKALQPFPQRRRGSIGNVLANSPVNGLVQLGKLRIQLATQFLEAILNSPRPLLNRRKLCSSVW